MKPPKLIQEIYEDFLRRREALITALTDDADEFHEACDPTRDNLCLYGFPDGSWKVDLPANEVPPEIPEPVLGINFARDGMERKDFLALCAVHSDAWLMSVLFFYAARFDDVGRAELFSLINQHPTVYEVTTGRVSRNKMFKRKFFGTGKSPGNNNNNASLHNAVVPNQQPTPMQFTFNGPVASDRPNPAGRLLVESDITPALKGRQAELFWPDDAKWYLVAIQSLDLRTSRAMVQYATGEEETLDLIEVINEKQMNLLT